MIKFQLYNEELRHLSSSFFCGNTIIDNFLKGPESCESDICKTYIMTNIDDETGESLEIIGFFSLSADSVLEKNDGILRQCGGAIRIYMFAIDNKYQQKHITIENIEMTYASLQLQICLQYIQQITEEHIGATYIILSATKEGVGLYRHFGFSELDDDIELSSMDEKHECLDMYKFIKDDEY